VHDRFEITVEAEVEELDKLDIGLVLDDQVDDVAVLTRLDEDCHQCKETDNGLIFVENVLDAKLDQVRYKLLVA
jgi:hypothetical protein